ncbi:phytyl ester synthase 1, chloroplastic-like isoform X1 [Typha latifolia]|uniref:phytyl ester synthase 1, chloroplastic-like isoform X1 n=2 Tax=Typha latifolia TaxID=4733 RepID=UPI003C2FD8B7
MASLLLPVLSSSPSPLRPPRFVSSNPRKLHSIASRGRPRASYKGLEVLYDDGCQKICELDDYFHAVAHLAQYDRGPPRWLCPLDAGPPIEDAPVMFFLPDVSGVGLGLLMHHKALGRIFELRCMHIPIHDRTPFEGLVHLLEDALRLEHSISPNKPIYLMGHSFGGCLALAVAAHNPQIDLVLILSNPATSIDKSELQPLFPVLRYWSNNEQSITLLFLLSFNINTEVKMALRSIKDGATFLQAVDRLSRNLSSTLRNQFLFETLPRDTFSWKIELLKSAASYANSHLQAVKAEVLVLASCLDSLLPSEDEAKRLQKLLGNCKVRYFKDHGHNLLLEGDVHLSTIIKSANMYRHSRKYDRISDYLPPTMTEFEILVKATRRFYEVTGPVMLSTMKDGKIVRGLSGIPNDGPVLLVGNHMYLGLDLVPLVREFLREKRIALRGIAHPFLFPDMIESSSKGKGIFDSINVYGGVPVSMRLFYRLLSEQEFVLLYPGGYREALHHKGEEYKLFWPSQPEFIRMAAQFSATIVPFGTVGEDDLIELLLSFDDVLTLPFGKDMTRFYSENLKIRDDYPSVCFPGVLPKIPGRFYYLFGKPIVTSGNDGILQDRNKVNDLYWHVKSEVERMICYLLKKRKEDYYRSIFTRSLYKAAWGSDHEVPTFEP